jgi:hypothetical protein
MNALTCRMGHPYHFIMLRRLTGSLFFLVLCTVSATGVGAQESDLQWRVEGGEDALEPTARVRLIVDNRLPAEAVDPVLGLVQTAVYLYRGDSPAAADIAAADSIQGMQLAAEDPLVTSQAPRTSVQVEDLDDDQVALGLIVGRDVAVVSAADTEVGGMAALRAVSEDLMERLRWSVETLIGSGQERLVWEGNVVLVVDRVYADFLAVRAPRLTHEYVAGSEALPVDNPAGGILGISPTATPMAESSAPGTRGTLLARAAGGRLHDLSLRRGVLNVIRITAEQSATGDFVVRIKAETEPLPAAQSR